ncbi:MAG TPA: hypothetical protein PKL17_10665 [Pseudomonadota bacterium]|nr:hypothetical protein [Pseudomonadota bacterium]
MTSGHSTERESQGGERAAAQKHMGKDSRGLAVSHDRASYIVSRK